MNSKKLPVVAASICLFNQSKQILLIQRKNPPSQFKWSVPGKKFFVILGGKVKFGELLVSSVQRELLEETSIESNNYKLFKKPFDVHEILEEDFHFIIFQFLGKLTSETKIKPSDDALDVKWFDVNELKMIPTSPNLTVVVEKGLEYLKTREKDK